MTDEVRALKAEIDSGRHSAGPFPSLAPRVPFAAHTTSRGAPSVPKRSPYEESKLRSRLQARAHDAVFYKRGRR
jgi:hypothetical protein